MKYYRRLLVAITALILLLIPSIVAAQAGQGLEISPPLLSLNADPGQVLHADMRVRNVTSQTLLSHAQYNDFVAGGEDGQPKILLNDTEQSPYSIKDWLGSIATVSLAPHEQKSIAVTITVPSNASPGGHYGVIRFTGTPPELDQSAVSLSASVGTLILVTVSGNIHEQAKLIEISTSQNNKNRSLFEYGPITITARVQNTGNVHLQPQGTITVTNMWGKRVANFQVNQSKGNVLPQSIRRFSVTLNNKLLFGRYKIMADVVYGKDSTIVSRSAYFWVIPYKLIVIILAILVLIVFLIRRYNRLIVKRARKGSGDGAKKKSNKKS